MVMSQWHSLQDVQSRNSALFFRLSYNPRLSEALFLLVNACVKCHGRQKTLLSSDSLKFMAKRKKALNQRHKIDLQENNGQKINPKRASVWASVQACLGGRSGLEVVGVAGVENGNGSSAPALSPETWLILSHDTQDQFTL